MVIKDGRFGAYVTDGESNATLRREDEIETMTPERAAELLAEKRAKGPAPKKRAPAKKAAPTRRTTAAKKAPAKKAAAAETATTDDAATEAPYGEGSSATQADGFDIKGNADSMKYHVPGSPHYDRTDAEVWFASTEAAEKAGFEPTGWGTDHPYGEGSHAPLDDPATAPDGYPVKGNADSMKYHTPESPWYEQTVAEVWFASQEAAEAAGFVAPDSMPDADEAEAAEAEDADQADD
jgi:hypothetical protein